MSDDEKRDAVVSSRAPEAVGALPTPIAVELKVIATID